MSRQYQKHKITIKVAKEATTQIIYHHLLRRSTCHRDYEPMLPANIHLTFQKTF